jgi:hypothetical protein
MTNKLPSDRVPIKCETKRNGNQQKRNQRNETKSTKWKRNQRKQNEIDWYEENGRIMKGKK